jgi:hypothetical protein
LGIHHAGQGTSPGFFYFLERLQRRRIGLGFSKIRAIFVFMKTPLFPFMILLGLVAGCGQSGNSSTASSSTNSSEGSVVTAPVDYLGAVAKGEQKAIKTIDTTSITSAIQLFQVDHGRYPKDLDELVKEKYLAQIPAAPYGTRIVYDSATGQVKVEKQ